MKTFHKEFKNFKMEEDEAQVVGVQDAELLCGICLEIYHRPHSLSPCLKMQWRNCVAYALKFFTDLTA